MDLPPDASRRSLRELGRIFFRLGCTSFGGPVAHLGYFHEEFVRRRRWLSADDYADLVALCQFLPGPASSQVVFGLGLREAGLRGALWASAAFLAPSAALMIGLGCGLGLGTHWIPAGLWAGLQVAAVAVVVQAVILLFRSLCPDMARRVIAAGALTALVLVSNLWIQLAVLAGGALVGRWAVRVPATASAGQTSPSASRGHFVAAGVFSVGLVLTALTPLWVEPTSGWSLAATFYRAGSLVFGGGHVVLPWLRDGVVAGGWVTQETFLTGYGAAQAVPGPLFSFAGYLGATAVPGPWAPWAGLLALGLLFLPAWLTVYAAWPWWQTLRSRPGLRAAMAGANAAVVGLLAAVAVTHLVPDAVHSPSEVVLALCALAGLLSTKVPVWLVVAGCAVAGAFFL